MFPGHRVPGVEPPHPVRQGPGSSNSPAGPRPPLRHLGHSRIEEIKGVGENINVRLTTAATHRPSAYARVGEPIEIDSHIDLDQRGSNRCANILPQSHRGVTHLVPLRFDCPTNALLSCTRRWRVREKAEQPVTRLAALLMAAITGPQGRTIARENADQR